MKKIGIFYGSTTGTTKKVAHDIGRILGVSEADIHDVASTPPSDVGGYEVLVLGSSTWNDGALQDDWYDFLAGMSVLDLSRKYVAVFGCGDETMSDTFCSAVGEIRYWFKDNGSKLIEPYDVVGYHFEHSGAVAENAVEAEGLLLDEVNHPELTAPRIAGWCALISEVAKG